MASSDDTATFEKINVNGLLQLKHAIGEKPSNLCPNVVESKCQAILQIQLIRSTGVCFIAHTSLLPGWRQPRWSRLTKWLFPFFDERVELQLSTTKKWRSRWQPVTSDVLDLDCTVWYGNTRKDVDHSQKALRSAFVGHFPLYLPFS